ncbi:hypothetical protein UA08_02750 [Talaromyces atroroseus]|uniref:RING-type domain-containing protein n=1 Tax=Talaromyces atroroseus TaxID=1441469 RepID=A0A225B7Z3_TALAT|nr:hypothetical protein UA08_02750 [Talaromyces atroroseus]OKL62057.1 hypothetical protein UA08_02750 [Talaromyces atroroseus]
MSPSVSRFTSPLRINEKGSQSIRGGGAEGEEKGRSGDSLATDNNHSATTSTPISATINEALRNNPFGSTSRARALEAEAQAASLSTEERLRRDLEDLNRSLVVLADLFPDVRIEVFRELLTRFDGQSRLHVCVEQLLRHKEQWVQGRWNVPVDDKKVVGVEVVANPVDGAGAVAPEELFRSEIYRNTVTTVLCKEFSGLSRSTIKGVLAEVNYSYTRARPTLKELSRKGWRATFINLNPFKRKKDSNRDDNPLVIWERSACGRDGDNGPPPLVPRLKQQTGSDELDQEIHQTLIGPFLREQKETQECQDYCLATELNEQEATASNALYECECCLDDVTFEQVSACSSESHMICFSCIQRTLHEAVFGQAWDKSVESERSTLKCVAPVSHGVCEGYLDPMLVKRAILSEKAGSETYRKFEDRLASEALMLKANLKLIRCPFCSYAEIDPVFHPSSSTSSGGGLRWKFRRDKTLISTIVTTILLLDLIPLLLLPFLILLLLYPQTATTLFHNSLQNLCLRSRSQRFTCKNPSCRQITCMTCHKPWRDPHTCEEPLQQSLRTTVEAARTAAVKRTCPRCNLSFVKSSGCNKLTCICGYSMCYICRKALNHRRGGVGEDDAADPDAGESGYRHFCEHFRVIPGTRCTECNKCELYFAEDDEAIARKAGEKAEREWRLRQSVLANNNNNANNNDMHNNHPYRQRDGNPTNRPTTTMTTTTRSSIFQFPWKQAAPPPRPPRPPPNPEPTIPIDSNYNNDNNNNKHDPYRISTTYYNHFNRASWHYWLIDIWQEKDRWKWEVQFWTDRLVERVVVVDVP